MNPLTILSLVSTAVQVLPQIQTLFKGGVANVTPATVSATLPQLEPLLAQLGSLISPNAEAAVHATVGAVAAFASGNTVAGMQGALNAYLANTPGFVALKVDGKYGPKTAAAVVMAQTKAGIKADGWFGQATAAALNFVLK